MISPPRPEATRLLQEVRRIARDVAAPAADAVDRGARFPTETVAALRAARVLCAGLPVAHGGLGLTLAEQGHLVAALATGCASSAMVLAMHLIQAACLSRHGDGSAAHDAALHDLAEHQRLLASMTSEVGTWGDTRTSICAVTPDPGDATHVLLAKDATTGSYCAHADAILVTARRHPDAAPGDQVLVRVRREDATLEATGTWDTLGMRGTCSPGFRLDARLPRSQVLPVGYPTISSATMVPWSHVLWSALWTGIAADAHARAAACVRAQARKSPGATPPAALRLSDLAVQLQGMRQHWQGVAQEVDSLPAGAAGEAELARVGWALKLNALKVAASEAAPRIVHGALQVVGIAGYKNDGPFSLGRAYRDALSASLMISNDRIAAQSASLLLVFKDD